MSTRGQRPRPPHLKLVSGNPGKRPIRSRQTDVPFQGGPIERPPSLRGDARKLWDQYIARAHWLTWADGPKALMWSYLQAEFEKAPGKMIAARLTHLRALGAELGFDPVSRDRMGITLPTGMPPPDSPNDNSPKPTGGSKYFD
jgi:hypothetical protein